MNLTLSGKTVGTLIGLLVGLLFVLVGWRIVLILLGFAAAGFLVGMWLDSQEDVKRRIRAAFRRLSGT